MCVLKKQNKKPQQELIDLRFCKKLLSNAVKVTITLPKQLFGFKKVKNSRPKQLMMHFS